MMLPRICALSEALWTETDQKSQAAFIERMDFHFDRVLEEVIETVEKRDPIIKRIETDFEKQPVAFIRILAANRGVLPGWHIRRGDAWLFVDEISVK